jgi:hypothetical protein
MIEEIMWNENPEDIRQEMGSRIIGLSRQHGPNHFPSNAIPLGYIIIGNIKGYRDRMEQALESDEMLRQWVKDHDTILVVAKVDGDQLVSYDFHANAKYGQHLLRPLES